MIWILAVLLLAASAQADVTRKHKINSEFMGANESVTADFYAADRQATESTVRWTKGFMKTASGGKEMQSGTITRIDKEVVWSLDPKKKTYTEMTFAEFREMMKKGMANMEDAQAEAKAERPDTISESLYEWKTEDLSESQPKTIGAWNCRNIHVVATGTNKNDPNDLVVITVNTWNSPDVPGHEEIRAYQERYIKALGLDMKAITPGLMQAAMLYQKQMDALIEAAKKAPGEPVQSLMEIQHKQPKGPSVGEAIGEGAKSELVGKLPFGRKKEPKKEEKPVYEMTVKFLVNSELVEANANSVAPDKFEIPTGYKLKKK
jgi:hypothetical protein